MGDDVLDNPPKLVEAKVSVAFRRSTDAEQGDIGFADGFLRGWRGTQASGRNGVTHHLIETMDAIRSRLFELGAASFHCAVLVEKKLKVKKPIHADFVGLEIEDRFVFGYGMDAKGYWRNLPEIRAMRAS